MRSANQSVTGKVGVGKIALAGNPNVGKSTVFNALTGLKQHTGNWAGKTVSNAVGYMPTEHGTYSVCDLPGTYSLYPHSAEEEVARSYICFGQADCIVVVCDATCLERNLNLALQIIETGARVMLCVNLLDEAKRKLIELDLALLSKRLGVEVVGICARSRSDIQRLKRAIDACVDSEKACSAIKIEYNEEVERAIGIVENALLSVDCKGISRRFLAIRLLCPDNSFALEAEEYLGVSMSENKELECAIESSRRLLLEAGIDDDSLNSHIATAVVCRASQVCKGVVSNKNKQYLERDRKIDRIITGRYTGYPVMLGLLAVIFWITIVGANYPSRLLSEMFSVGEGFLTELLYRAGFPTIVHDALVFGVYRVLTWVVAVMLPPMAIFFPLFTLLEDAGILPRIAYNLDHAFKKCNACGKQALTMCMGFGCNAVGVVGCRIIDSPRERLLAVLTNTFVPCNGRFPTIIALIAMFFVGGAGVTASSVFALVCVILLGVLATFAVTKVLSITLLKGEASSFTLELPPYRPPRFLSVVASSVLNRTLFVLGRAVIIAIPAGLLLWIFANVYIGDLSLLSLASQALDPFARLMGLDGVILLAFILGFPANEIVLPIAIMAYTSQSTITELADIAGLREILLSNGWSVTTAICFVVFMLFHFPCSTTLLTIKKETASVRYTLLAFAIPTLCGVLLCMALRLASELFVKIF